MTAGRRAVLRIAALQALCSAALPAQQDEVPRAAYTANRSKGDLNEWIATGGLLYRRGGLEVRADSAVVVLDQQEYLSQIRGAGEKSGLPRRDSAPPDARRALGEAVLRQRLLSFLRAARRGDTAVPDVGTGRLELFRSLYLEGNVVVVQDGVEVLRASRLYFSAVDDRAVFRDVVLRLESRDRLGNSRLIVVRGDELLRQGPRITGRNLSVTSCTAGEPHFEVFSGETEIIERGDEFEIRSRDNSLAFSGVSVLPLPDLDFFTSYQNQLPVRSVAAGYSEKERLRAELVLGSSYNRTGGAVHRLLTGRPAEEFRGDWSLGIGYVETRGVPLDAELQYRAEGVYHGHTRGFYLDDRGDDIREIRSHLDGTPITESERTLLHSENRVHLGAGTTLDLSLFDAGDPAVYSEFFRANYFGDERPETSAHLRHWGDDYIATATGRWNLAGFSYADGRELTPRFIEQEPSLTFDWFSQPLLELPGETPLLLTSSTGIAELQSDFDRRFAAPVDDRTLRLDQEIELAAPFLLGPFGLRPFADARITHYDHTATGGSRTRWAFAAGARLGTRLSRSWSWAADGETRGIRHVLSPTVEFIDRFHVDGEPGDFHRFDSLDELDEAATVRLGLLQRLLHSTTGAAGSRVHDFVWLDLAQTLYPRADRDNAGHGLGLLEFEMIFRPEAEWLHLPHWTLVVEGEHDWNADELRTFNVYNQLLAGGVTWLGEYRTDRTSRGVIGYGALAPLRGRWTVMGHSQFDLELRENISYLAQLVRTDHDWQITAGLRFDNITDDTSFDILFQPTLGGLITPLWQRYAADPLFGGGSQAGF